MYFLQNNVEIVAGAKRYCIYDLNTKKLYNMDEEYFNYINSLVNPNHSSTTIIPNEVVEFLINSGILATKENLIPKIEPYHYEDKINFAWIEITQNCNLICRHCYEGSSRITKSPEMNINDFKFVIDSLVAFNVKEIQLVGGEPLIHSQIKDIVKYALGKFSHIEIFTNGTLLNDDLFDLIKDTEVSLAFSVYSEDAKLHDYVTRTKNSFDTTFSNIKKSIDRNIAFRIASVEMKNIPSFSFTQIEVQHQIDLPRLTGRADLSLYSEDMLRRKFITKENFKKPLSLEEYQQNKLVHNCFSEKIYIDCNLNVFPCAMERRVSYGNLHNTSLEKIKNNSLSKMNKDKITDCKDCEYRYACFDCRADSNCSDINSKPWYCTYNPQEGKWINIDNFVDLLMK